MKKVYGPRDKIYYWKKKKLTFKMCAKMPARSKFEQISD